MTMEKAVSKRKLTGFEPAFSLSIRSTSRMSCDMRTDDTCGWPGGPLKPVSSTPTHQTSLLILAVDIFWDWLDTQQLPDPGQLRPDEQAKFQRSRLDLCACAERIQSESFAEAVRHDLIHWLISSDHRLYCTTVIAAQDLLEERPAKEALLVAMADVYIRNGGFSDPEEEIKGKRDDLSSHFVWRLVDRMNGDAKVVTELNEGHYHIHTSQEERQRCELCREA